MKRSFLYVPEGSVRAKALMAVRVLTVAPLTSLLALCVLLRRRPELFFSRGDFALAVLFLTLLPLAAYPLQPLLPRFAAAGRAGQRRLAMVMAVAGYLLGSGWTLLVRRSRELAVIFLVSLFSGALVQFFNRVLHVKASGHAAGASAPLFYLSWFLGPRVLLPGLLVLALVFWASLGTHRHTLRELTVGSLLPLLALALAALLTHPAARPAARAEALLGHRAGGLAIAAPDAV